MPMNMPTLADLQDLYGAGSVSALQQAEQQQGLARQFAQGELAGQAQNVRKTELANMFDEQQNPQLLEQRRLENIGIGDKNTLSGVASRIGAATEGMQLTEKQRQFALTATQQDLDMADKWAEGEIRSGNPQRMQEARKILDFSSAARTAKALADAAMERQKEQSRSHLQGIGAQIKSQKELRQMDIDAGKYTKSAKDRDILTSLNKLTPATRVGPVKAMLESGAKPDGTPLTDIEKMYFQSMYSQDVEVVNANNAARAGQGITGQATPEGGVALVNKTPPRIGEGGVSAAAPRMTAQDQAALEWANANPNDPRAAKIKQKLGK